MEWTHEAEVQLLRAVGLRQVEPHEEDALKSRNGRATSTVTLVLTLSNQ